MKPTYRTVMLAMLVCGVATKASGAIRDYYNEPGLNPLRETINDNFNEHIDPFSGILQLSFTDVFIPGDGGLDLKIRRVYTNPQETFLDYSPYGYGWRIHFGRIVVSRANDDKICSQNSWDTSVRDNPSLELPDGSRHLLVLADYHEPELITRNFWAADCDGDEIIVRSPDGVRYEMTHWSTGRDMISVYTTRIEDPNGNSIDIQYETNSIGHSRIEGVTTSDGRDVDFQYDDTGTDRVRLEQIEANGRTWDYEYEFTNNTIPDFPQLVEVERPDRSRWRYSYYPQDPDDPGSLALQRVEYPWGGYIEYTYDEVDFDPHEYGKDAVVSRKETGGRDIDDGEWTFEYTPGWKGNDDYDETVVEKPDGGKRYYHVGYSTVGSGDIWRIGLKKREETLSSGGRVIDSKEWDYTWVAISDENYWHGRDTTKKDDMTVSPRIQEVRHWRQYDEVKTTYSDTNAYGMPQEVTETTTASSWPPRVTTYEYANDESDWILGLVEEKTVEHDVHPDGGRRWTIQRSFDDAGNVVSEDRYGAETTYSYTSEGNVASVTDPRRHTTRYDDYYLGVPQHEGRPDGTDVYRDVNSDGTIASVTDGRGNTTRYGWDALGRLTGIDYPVRADVHVDYDYDAKVLTRGSYREVREWDGFGRPTHITRDDTTTPGSITTKRTRDAMGRVNYRSYPGSRNGDVIGYDALGRREYISHADGTSRVFDYASGTEVVIEDENGHETTRHYVRIGAMDDGWLMRIESPESITTTLARDARGKMVRAVRDNRSGADWVREYAYDDRGYLTSATHPETGVTQYGRDAAGNMTAREVGESGIVERFRYDERNRVTRVTYSDGSPTAYFDYDGNGNLTGLERGDVQRSFSYDANDNLTGETLAVGVRRYEVGYAIDGLDHVRAITYPSGRQVEFAPNVLGWETQAAPYATEIAHHPNGTIKEVAFANGATMDVALDNRQRIKDIETAGSGGRFIDLRYRYDANGNIVDVADGMGGRHDRNLDYDGANRLISATGPWGRERFSYDSAGNIVSRERASGSVLDYEYEGMRLVSREVAGGERNYRYDARGNVIRDGATAYGYDGGGNLVRANTGDAVVTYAYDGDGNRVRRDDGSTVTDFFYSRDGKLLGAYDVAGGFREYVYVGGQLISKITDDSAVVGSRN
ncbi:hypothetical protein [Arhodomonas sp. AD133]|uniref:RHS repeat domain-containing protein n=1 Tax=Arhodomonas sp. AD133 TaxID=3415009 RepID=UPI003EB896C9